MVSQKTDSLANVAGPKFPHSTDLSLNVALQLQETCNFDDELSLSSAFTSKILSKPALNLTENQLIATKTSRINADLNEYSNLFVIDLKITSNFDCYTMENQPVTVTLNVPSLLETERDTHKQSAVNVIKSETCKHPLVIAFSTIKPGSNASLQ